MLQHHISNMHADFKSALRARAQLLADVLDFI